MSQSQGVDNVVTNDAFVIEDNNIIVPAGRYAMGDAYYFPSSEKEQEAYLDNEFPFNAGYMSMLGERQSVRIFTDIGNRFHTVGQHTFSANNDTVALIRLLDTDPDDIVETDVMTMVSFSEPTRCRGLEDVLRLGRLGSHACGQQAESAGLVGLPTP